ncbi:conjugal transfer protein TraI [Rhizosphaericola mali]|uniref:Conjugal transfer protein TraI n=1 Tax=Rhizosphaericola mali TaxID=2545455 RepID=A0A5P2G1K7_9BACT|nr:conjugal transfer protein TraI [Rhizosphaericola mali]QES89684.1 conjugal transfer protein TraI [Rhizosphaericola mali]
MKTKFGIVLLSLVLTIGMSVAPTTKSHALFGSLFSDAIKAAIKAIDISIQKLQNQTIVLQNAQKVVENTMGKLKLDEIAAFAQKEQTLFSGYYQELQQVKSVISGYKKVGKILQMQTQMVSDYKTAYNLFKNDAHFTPKEILYMYTVYTGILDKSVQDLSALTTIISAYSTQMSDGRRLALIEKLATNMENNRITLLQFNRQNQLVCMSRARSETEVKAIKSYYGL